MNCSVWYTASSGSYHIVRLLYDTTEVTLYDLEHPNEAGTVYRHDCWASHATMLCAYERSGWTRLP